MITARTVIITAKAKKPPKRSAAVKRISKTSASSPSAFLSEINLSNMSTITSKIRKKIATSSILKIIYVESGTIPVSTVNYTFSAADLVNNKLTKYHGFNDRVDVSVFSNLGEEVEVEVDSSNNNSVTIDLGRLVITGNWQIKIEK